AEARERLAGGQRALVGKMAADVHGALPLGRAGPTLQSAPGAVERAVGGSSYPPARPRPRGADGAAAIPTRHRRYLSRKDTAMPYRINHIHLKASDPRKTADWYVKAFAFKIVSDETRVFGDRFVRCQSED